MRYRTNVTFITGSVEYKPGEILPEDISKDDLAFLKSKGFVVPTDVMTDITTRDEVYSEDENGDFIDFDEMEPDALKSSEEIRKIRSKNELAKYAKTIGFDIGEDFEGKSLKELQEEVINFQEEKLEEDGIEEN